jgi:hypothetical protein
MDTYKNRGFNTSDFSRLFIKKASLGDGVAIAVNLPYSTQGQSEFSLVVGNREKARSFSLFPIPSLNE